MKALIDRNQHNLPEERIEMLWLFWQDGIALASALTAQHPAVAEREEVLDVPADVVEKARRLQALAMDEAAAPQERENAWAAFSKIWQEHKLPGDFGL